MHAKLEGLIEIIYPFSDERKGEEMGGLWEKEREAK